MQQAKRAGFNGGLVIDYPESTKAKKYYLVLVAGGKANPVMPEPLSNVPSNTVQYTGRGRESHGPRQGAKSHSVKEWIQNKKDRRRRQGKETCHDSKYTGRKRSSKF